MVQPIFLSLDGSYRKGTFKMFGAFEFPGKLIRNLSNKNHDTDDNYCASMKLRG